MEGGEQAAVVAGDDQEHRERSRISDPHLKGFSRKRSQTLNEIFQKIGGFGRFQIILTLILLPLRNFGSIPVYGTAINLKP